MTLRLLSLLLVITQCVLGPHILFSQTQWEPLGPYGGTVASLKTDGNEWVYAVIRGSGVFRSMNAGRTWVPSNTGLSGAEVTAFCVGPDGRIFCGSENMFAVSSDHGNQWTMLPAPLPGLWIMNILVLPDSEIYVSFWYDNRLMHSKDQGKTWNYVTGIPQQWGSISALERGPNNTVIIGTEGVGLYQFYPRTHALTCLNYDLPVMTVGATPYDRCEGFIVHEDGSILLPYFNTVHRLDPQTKQWTKLQDRFRSRLLYQGKDSLVYGYNFAIIVASSDFGETWTTVPVPWEIVDAIFFVKVNGSILLSEGTGFWRSDDNSKSWNAADQGIVRTDISCGLVTSANSVIVGTSHAGIFRSGDGGFSWSNILFPHPGGYGDEIVAVKKNAKGTLFAASKGLTNSIWRSRTDGSSWTQTAFKDSSVGMGVSFIITDLFIDAQDNLYVSGYAVSNDAASGVFRSTNEGDTWTRVFSVPSNSTARSFLMVDDNLALMGTFSKGFFRSTNRGAAWTQISGTNGFSQINSIIQDTASILLAATGSSGILRSADMGLTWAPSNTGLIGWTVRTVSKLSSGQLFAGTEKGGFISKDHGLSWTSVTSSDAFRSVGSVFAGGNGTVYVATDAGLYRAATSPTTGVHFGTDRVAPENFRLSPNYPNPFNPSTTISFDLPSRQFTSLKIFDVMGREMATIVSGELPAGNYTREWNASGMPSGVYYCRLQAGAWTATQRLLLIK